MKSIVKPLFLLAFCCFFTVGCVGSGGDGSETDDETSIENPDPQPEPEPEPEPEPPIENAFWNVDDKGDTVVISRDGREVTFLNGIGGAVRSKHALSPREGYYYLELDTTDVDTVFFVGVALLDRALGAGDDEVIIYNTDNQPERVGVAVDYRGMAPVISFLQIDSGGIQSNVRTVIKQDWFGEDIAFFLSAEQTLERFRIELNRNDFAIDFESGVSSLIPDAQIGIVPGWPSDNAQPSISINTETIVLLEGSEFNFLGESSDPEDGDISNQIEWLLDGSPAQVGNTYSAVPALGRHKVSARVVDSFDQESITVSRFLEVISDVSLDNDLDTLSFEQEMGLGTNPGLRDTDDDGLPDNQEIELGTNPVVVDSDGDSMADGYEVDNGLNPLADDASGDLDSDGVSNALEAASERQANNQNDYPNIGAIGFTAVQGELNHQDLAFEMLSSGMNVALGNISVSPESGWHYFEGSRLVPPGNFGFGVASVSSSLSENIGGDDLGVSVSSLGQITYGGEVVANFTSDVTEVHSYGLAIDYSGTNPVLHVLLAPDQSDYEILAPIELNGISDDLNIVVFGESQGELVQQKVNIGADKRNHAFIMSPKYLLTHAGFSGAITMAEGWGSEFAYEPLVQPPIENSVYFVKDDRVHPGLYLSEDRLAVSYMVDQKMAVLANQGMYDQFWYWEAHREIEPQNYGFGLNNPYSFLKPYCCINTSLPEVAPSTSINALGGIWRNLVLQSNLPFGPSEHEYYGFAVDYTGEYPIVYPIAGDQVLTEVHLTDFLTTPIYPMLYGNHEGGDIQAANSANFGAEPFVNDARQALINFGVDVTHFRAGWGIYAQ